MDPKKVFEEFQNLCTDHAGHLQYYLARNCVLEWFGRTIRGRDKIKNFIRHELSQEYDHLFTNWRAVEPFEVRSSHFETKTRSREIPEIHSVNTTEIPCSGNVTPSRNKIKITNLPALNRGIKFLPESDSDEEDFKELGLAKILDSTPPSSPTHSNSTFVKIEEPPVKKFKQMPKFRTLFSTKEKKFINHTAGCYSAIEEDKSSNKMDQIDSVSIESDPEYSELKYIEATGRLFTMNRSKYSGGQNSNDKKDDKIDGDFSSELNYSCLPNERDARLKISYRTRLDNNRIEFALIIYEHSVRKPSIRRNLLAEFKEVSSDSNEVNPITTNKDVKSSKTKDNRKNDNLKVKRKTPLKRLLRLF